MCVWASIEMILMKKLGMFYQNTIGFGAVRMTVVPGAMSNVWRIQLKALFVPSVKMCLCDGCILCYYSFMIYLYDPIFCQILCSCHYF